MTATSDATRPRGAEDDAATATSAVHLRALTKSYGDVAAVRGIDLDIAQGEFFSMLGPSGSGKTTTLRMIAGFETPTSGTILLDGQDVTERAALRAGREHGVPGLRAVPAHGRRGERRVRAHGPEGARGRAPATRRGGAADGPARGLRGPPPGAALGRPAPARGAGSGARQPAARAAAGRAARSAGPEAAPGDADRAQDDPAGGRHHLHLRDPRPGRGARDERPDGDLQPRASSSRSARRPMSTRRRRRRSSRASSAPRTSSRATPRRPSWARAGTFTVRPEKIHLEDSDAAVPDWLDSATGTVQRRRLPRVGHALPRRRSTPAASSSSSSRTSPPHPWSALALKGKPVRLTWDREHTLAVARRLTGHSRRLQTVEQGKEGGQE